LSSFLENKLRVKIQNYLKKLKKRKINKKFKINSKKWKRKILKSKQINKRLIAMIKLIKSTNKLLNKLLNKNLKKKISKGKMKRLKILKSKSKP
jgi:hypothetical protein